MNSNQEAQPRRIAGGQSIELDATRKDIMKKFLNFVRTHPSALYWFLIPLLIWGTGIVSDDLDEIRRIGSGWNWNWLLPTAYIDRPVLHYSHIIWYKIFTFDSVWVFDLVKIGYLLFSLYCMARFLTLFFSLSVAWFASFLFLFYPSHDATTYFYLGQYLTLSFAFYGIAYVKAAEDKFVVAGLLALLGSFVSYGSTPVAIAFSFLFVLHCRYRAALVLAVPNVLYIAYYYIVTVKFDRGTKRIPHELDILALGKYFILQIGTALDATVGPSFAFKVLASIGAISGLGVILALGFTLAGVVLSQSSQRPDAWSQKKLLLALALMTCISLGMFALTGHYPQLAFNLGNRITIYSALLASCILATVFQKSRFFTGFIALLLLLVSFGLTEHWRNWQETQRGMLVEIREMDRRGEFSGEYPIFVTGLRYSRLGRFDHIEGISERSVANSTFELATGKRFSTIPLSRAMRVRGGELVDTKYGSVTPLPATVRLVDLEKGSVTLLTRAQLADRILALPPDRRHWIQLIDSSLLRALVLFLMPRLGYAFETE